MITKRHIEAIAETNGCNYLPNLYEYTDEQGVTETFHKGDHSEGCDVDHDKLAKRMNADEDTEYHANFCDLAFAHKDNIIDALEHFGQVFEIDDGEFIYILDM